MTPRCIFLVNNIHGWVDILVIKLYNYCHFLHSGLQLFLPLPVLPSLNEPFFLQAGDVNSPTEELLTISRTTEQSFSAGQ